MISTLCINRASQNDKLEEEKIRAVTLQGIF
jgi:hypothetical protein